MIKKISLGLLVLSLTTSCVSKKIFADLETKFAELKKERNALSDENETLKTTKNQFQLDNATLKTELDKLKAERDKLAADYAASSNNLKTLQSSYNALEKNSDESLKANMDKNRDLLAQLEAKEKALAAEKGRLAKLSGDLKDRSDRVNELEALIAAKEASMKKLKETLSKSLKAFEGKGLTVQQKDGKVYVSMENKLLFESGSWAVGTEGKKAVVAVAKVLGDNPDISILIEGHTDNDKFAGAVGQIENNWDLSTKRATSIVNILGENPKVNKQNLTAAGRGEFSPLMSNDTPEGKAKNRRIEIILTPKLDEISKMLNDI
ncbi:OmpA family protein [Flavobacterium psychrophilum]|uniref:Flagellar motor/Chemotaxis (MotB)-related lipoprotein n=2 Tax=Flavobacterium psychrophilum TaxID=96345 RepID=A6GVQ8_FLAPJ|nr:OmpA family protein [Flavobacterium psychrophilum]AIG29012.1 cell envelope biogenesis protein OmpA [Flavobacterium psychrophilum]AIG31288.1 cell envelope biogenesis protein OmpA [Flavobacterium psychrophilum]AIG35708.1 cell envelope biogenesis protein OmpA [Flavobacterium psychrophilum]AIG35814.1 cell envelope biogenesis protein OmpA [Flavobacterium psychrophilum]AIG38069.1 cell envelope biogenesis protein OmpA [Flavobacterium psychrophilum]